MTDRDISLRRAILEELDNTPRSYLQAEAMVHCEVDALGTLKWCITGIGRAALNER